MFEYILTCYEVYNIVTTILCFYSSVFKYCFHFSDVLKVLKSNSTYTLPSCTIKVKEYYSDLGIIPDGYNNSSPGFSIPESCDISIFEQSLIDFITCSPTSKKFINDYLDGAFAEVDWNASQLENKLKVVCCLKYSTTGVHDLAKKWLNNIKEKFDRVRDQFIFVKIDVLQTYWPQYLASYEELISNGMTNSDENVKIILDEKCYCTTVVGFKPIAGSVAEKMNKILSTLESKTLFKKNSITETLSMLKLYQIELLVMVNLLPTLEKDYEVQFHVDTSCAKLDVIGLPYNVREAKIKVLEYLSTTVQRSIKCSPNMVKLASTDQSTREALRNILNAMDDDGNSVLATFEVGDNCINVLAPNDIEVQRAWKRIDTYTLFINYHIKDLPYQGIIREQNWRSLVGCIILNAEKNVILEYSQDYQNLMIRCPSFTTTLVTVNENYDKLTFDGTSSEIAAEDVRNYLDSKATFEHFVPLSLGIVRYFHDYGRNCLDEAEKAFKTFSVRLLTQIDNDLCGVKVTGLKSGCESVCILLQKLSDSFTDNKKVEQGKKGDLITKLEANINRTKHVIVDKTLNRFLLSDSGRSFIMDIEKQQKVIIDKISTENLIDTSDKFQKECIVLVKNVEIASLLCDIATMNVDAIVNPANEQLSLGSGVAGAIRRIGNMLHCS